MRTFQLNKLLTNSEWLLGTNIFAIFHCDAFLRRNHSSARREPIKFKMFLAFTDFCVWRDAFSDLQKGGGGGGQYDNLENLIFSTHFFNHSLYLTENTRQTQNQVCGVTRKQASTKLTCDSHNVIFSPFAYNKGYLILNTPSCRIST